MGGCCGTNPEFIEKLTRSLREKNFAQYLSARKEKRERKMRYLTSERLTWKFSLDDQFFIVGERINPTGKKKLQAQLREGSFEMVRTLPNSRNSVEQRYWMSIWE